MDYETQQELADKIAVTLHNEFLLHDAGGLDLPEILELI